MVADDLHIDKEKKIHMVLCICTNKKETSKSPHYAEIRGIKICLLVAGYHDYSRLSPLDLGPW